YQITTGSGRRDLHREYGRRARARRTEKALQPRSRLEPIVAGSQRPDDRRADVTARVPARLYAHLAGDPIEGGPAGDEHGRVSNNLYRVGAAAFSRGRTGHRCARTSS